MMKLLPKNEMSECKNPLLEHQYQIGMQYSETIRSDLQEFKSRLVTKKRMLEWMQVIVKGGIPSHWKWTGCKSTDTMGYILEFVKKYQYINSPTEPIQLDLLFDPVHFVNLTRTVVSKRDGKPIESLVALFVPSKEPNGFHISGIKVLGAEFTNQLHRVADVDVHEIPSGTLLWHQVSKEGIPVYASIEKKVELFRLKGQVDAEMIKRGVVCYIP
jgi:hypothetical protein